MVTTQGRFTRPLALGVTALLVLAACGTGTATPSPVPTEPPTPAPTSAPPSGTVAPTATPAPTPVVTATPEPVLTGGTMFMLMSTATSVGGIHFQDMDPQRTYTGEDLAFLGATINRSLNAYTYSDDPAVASGLMPDAATDTGTASADAKTWTFTVRDGIKWQDGSAVTCEDFKYGASRVFAQDLVGGGPAYALAYLDIPTNDDGTSQYPGPYSATADQQALFDQAVTCDGSTITYHLKNPVADFNYTVTLGMGAVPSPASHPDLVIDTGEAYDQAPWSNGPYMIESLVPDIGGHLHLIRNPFYDASTDESGRMAYPDDWMVLFGIDPGVMDQRLMNPNGDDSFAVSYGAVQPENLDTVFSDPHTTNPAFAGRAFSDYDPYSSYYPIRTDVVTNVKIRQAMAVALNRDALRQNGGGDFVGDYGDGFIKPNIGMDYAPTHLWDAAGPFGQDIPGTGDPALAMQLIADLGEAAPTLTWQYISSPTSDRGAGIIQDSLQLAGFTVNLSVIPGNRYACYFDPTCQTEFQAAGWGPDRSAVSRPGDRSVPHGCARRRTRRVSTRRAGGGRLIDTASVYGHGESELAIGTWLRTRGTRDEVVLLDQGCPSGRARLVHPGHPRDDPHDLSGSLERLGVPAVDIYLVHRDRPAVLVGEILDALAAEVAAGRARSFGVSNWTIERLDEANAYAAARGWPPIAWSSPSLALARPTGEQWPGTVDAGDDASRAWYATHPTRLEVWSPTANGYFAADADLAEPWYDAYRTQGNEARRARAAEFGAARGLTASQVALAWVISQPFAPVAVIGTRTVAHLRAAIEAASVCLTEAELAWLEHGDPTTDGARRHAAATWA